MCTTSKAFCNEGLTKRESEQLARLNQLENEGLELWMSRSCFDSGDY